MKFRVVEEEANRPVGGQLQFFRHNWEQISRDPWILETILGSRLEFSDHPHQRKELTQIPLSKEKAQALDGELEKMAAKQAIKPVGDSSQATFVSPMFVVTKADGAMRLVINLKCLNQHILARHFKMESIRTAKGLLCRGDWMIKLDQGRLPVCSVILPAQEVRGLSLERPAVEIHILPFGLSSAPFILTKLIKPIVATLRKLGVRHILYLDDMAGYGTDEGGGEEAPSHSLGATDSPGFHDKHEEKCSTPGPGDGVPGFCVGFEQDVHFPTESEADITTEGSKQAQAPGSGPVRQLAQVLGMMVAAHPAILPAPLHFRYLERARARALGRGLAYKTQLEMSQGMETDLIWWIEEAGRYNGRSLQIAHWDLTVETDASRLGWVACCQGVRTGGRWTLLEKQKHINYLELLAAFLALRSFLPNRRNLNFLLRIDNVIAIAFLNRMGGTHSQELSDLAVRIWEWCIEKEIVIHVEHLLGKENVRADWESRHVRDSCDWMLKRVIFLQLESRLGPFSIDLFASRTMHSSLYTAAGAQTQQPWENHHTYVFPPFALITRCLEKLRLEQARAVLIAQSALVPLSPQGLNRLSNPVASSAGHFNRPRGPEPFAGASGPPPSGRLAHLRRSLHHEGLSEGAIELLRKSWRTSTESAYSSAWRQWDSWCLRRVLIPFQHL